MRQYSLPRPASYSNNKFINSECWPCTRWWISAPQIAITQASLVDGCPCSDLQMWFCGFTSADTVTAADQNAGTLDGLIE